MKESLSRTWKDIIITLRRKLHMELDFRGNKTVDDRETIFEDTLLKNFSKWMKIIKSHTHKHTNNSAIPKRVYGEKFALIYHSKSTKSHRDN